MVLCGGRRTEAQYQKNYPIVVVILIPEVRPDLCSVSVQHARLRLTRRVPLEQTLDAARGKLWLSYCRVSESDWKAVGAALLQVVVCKLSQDVDLLCRPCFLTAAVIRIWTCSSANYCLKSQGQDLCYGIFKCYCLDQAVLALDLTPFYPPPVPLLPPSGAGTSPSPFLRRLPSFVFRHGFGFNKDAS